MQAILSSNAVSRLWFVRAVTPRLGRFKTAMAGVASWRLLLARDRARAAEGRRQIATLKGEIAAHVQTNGELRRAKDAAEAANDAKTRYLVSVSHEIRSPLNTIYGYAQLLERDDGLSGVEAGAVIRRSAEHLTNLVEGLLEISRIEGGVMKLRSDSIDIRRLLEHSVEMFHMQASSKGLNLRLIVKDRLPERVWVDEKKLRQILINLISNAIKYTQTGSVAITVGYRSQVADIEVRDTGIGIPPDDIDRVFEPFERGNSAEARRQPGIGLGLSITRVLARVMGGDLALTSTPGDGSSFRLRMMLSPATATVGDDARVDRITGYRGARRTVLVIDDDASQSIILQSLLRPLGFIVHAAANGSEGLALAGRNKPEIVLLDIQMPGMNGWDVAARLRAEYGRAIKIIMASANAHEFRAGGDGNSNHDAFITKPIDLDALLALIGIQSSLTWERAEPSLTTQSQPLLALPVEVEPFLQHLRQLVQVGHVRGIAEELEALEGNIPAAGPLVTVLKGQLNDLDLRSFSKTLDDARL